MANLKILAVGDVVGNEGCGYLLGGKLRRTAESLGADLVIVNGENSASGNGMSREVIDECSLRVKIPMSDRIESLNAAVSAAVLMWELRG